MRDVFMKKVKKSKFIAFLLALFLGGIGIHKFYLNKNKIGILYVLFCWTSIPFYISIIEAVILLFMPKSTFESKYIQTDFNNHSSNKNFDNSIVSTKCICDDKEYQIIGRRNSFVIKDATYEFLVKNGEIVAFKNKNLDKNFVEYSGGHVNGAI